MPLHTTASRLHSVRGASAPLRPLLKWAGGKRQLLDALRCHYPARFSRYIEPFLGSGAVFFDLFAAGRLAGRRTMLSDVNRDLIGTYLAVRDRTEEVIRALRRLERAHEASGGACYYEVRDRRFNPQRARLEGGAASAPDYPVELAAMFIYLNRTAFNGLFRLNRAGAFNVPAGRYEAPRICDPEHLRSVAAAFRSSRAEIAVRAFDRTLAEAGAGDFVYCDPPYAPLSRTSSFAQYTAGGFSLLDQRRLCDAVIEACRRGAAVIVSNSSVPEIVDAYRSAAARRAQLRVFEVPARRAINSRASARGPVTELIITNVTHVAQAFATGHESGSSLRRAFPAPRMARVDRAGGPPAAGRSRAERPAVRFRQ